MEISHASSIFLLTLFVFSTIGNKNSWSRANRFSLFLGISLIFELGSITTAAFGIHNFWIFKIFLIVELLYFNYFHRDILNSTIDIRGINAILIIALIISSILGFIFEFINPWFLTILIIYFIAQNGLILLSLFKQRSDNLLQQSQFWVCIGRLSYFMLIFFIFFGANIFNDLYKNVIFLNTFLVTNIVANFLRYSAYTKSLLVNG